ncbi:MAG: ATP-binding cassette domain-containing protein, partial [Pirellulaceae bacterium]|nr:ATP-binding cassette domain-containing protein [Pirellulaceae bacterium]
MSIVQVREVTKRFRKGDQEIVPLQECSLEIEQGEFVSLMGASGSGKSTLLNL